jgi:hypothetical protein
LISHAVAIAPAAPVLPKGGAEPDAEQVSPHGLRSGAFARGMGWSALHDDKDGGHGDSFEELSVVEVGGPSGPVLAAGPHPATMSEVRSMSSIIQRRMSELDEQMRNMESGIQRNVRAIKSTVCAKSIDSSEPLVSASASAKSCCWLTLHVKFLAPSPLRRSSSTMSPFTWKRGGQQKGCQDDPIADVRT